MSISPVPIPPFLFWLTLIASLVCLLIAVRHAPWKKFKASQHQHVFLGASVAILLLWSVRAGISSGLDIHLLGITTLTLMFGWQLALITLAVVVLGLGFAGLEAWNFAGMNYVIAGVVPVAVSWGIFRWADTRLPNHFFVYLFVSVFLAAALSVIAMSAALTVLLVAAKVYSFDRIVHEYLSFLPLFALPEAVLNGFVMTAMIALRPHWVCTFDDARYLKGK